MFANAAQASANIAETPSGETPAGCRRDVRTTHKLRGMTRTRALALTGLAELLGMSLWFTASAVAPKIASEGHLTPGTTSWLTLAVQLGFLAGTLISAIANLPDLLNVRRLFAVSALAGPLTPAPFPC